MKWGGGTLYVRCPTNNDDAVKGSQLSKYPKRMKDRTNIVYRRMVKAALGDVKATDRNQSANFECQDALENLIVVIHLRMHVGLTILGNYFKRDRSAESLLPRSSQLPGKMFLHSHHILN
jgi:hypothetical protein